MESSNDRRFLEIGMPLMDLAYGALACGFLIYAN